MHLLPYAQDVRSSRLRRMQHEDGEAAQSQGVDEDSERETWLNQIALASLRAADRLSSIQQVCLSLTPLYCSSKVFSLGKVIPDGKPSWHAHCHSQTCITMRCVPSMSQERPPDGCAGAGRAQACSVIA